ncbi:MAG: ComEC/Rec2 family competence protein, partial [Cyanobacteriota bacterium]|nr:ComEC/Rec2 family competence protein [Cyanobacteriota bacterium]
PAITKRLDWLPPAIATLIAVPLAASVWTLPLLIYVFNTIATYSLVVNLIATPLISLISLGGMVSAAAALVFPPAGSAIAWLLQYPTQLLIAIVHFFTHLPGSSWAVGTISLGQLLVIYGLLLFVWLNPWMQRRWGLAVLAALILVVLPLAYQHSTQLQVTILPARSAPVVVVRDKGKTIAIASPDEDTARYTLLPFLRNQGLNALDLAIPLENPQKSGWKEVFANLRVKTVLGNAAAQNSNANDAKKPTYQPLQVGQPHQINSTVLQVLNPELPVLQLKIQGRDWLLVGNSSSNPEARDRLLKLLPQQPFEVLLWSGAPLDVETLANLKPNVAIAPSFAISPETQPQSQPQIQHYATERDGTVQWTPKRGWQTISQPE